MQMFECNFDNQLILNTMKQQNENKEFVIRNLIHLAEVNSKQTLKK